MGKTNVSYMEINIFKAGEQTSSTGNTREFTIEDLDQVVESYSSEVHEAPIRIGHEDQSDKTPAWGWVEKLTRKGMDLFAEVNFVPQMAQYIEDKLYKKVSASFYHPESNVNPHKGKWSLRHVAVLGAEPPAVKGLKGFAYNEVVEDFVNCSEVEISGDDDQVVSELIESNPELGPTLIEEETPMGKLKEELLEAIEEKEEEAVAPTPPSSDEEFKEEVAIPSPEESDEDPEEEEEKKDPEEPAKSKKKEPEVEEEDFNEASPPTDDFSEENSTLKTKVSDLEYQVKQLQAKLRRAEIQEFIEGIYDSGRITEEMISEEDMLQYMEKIDQGYVDFAEGESPLTPLMKILEKLPQAVCFTEIVKDEDFSEEELDQVELTPHEKAIKLMGETGLEYTEALKKAIYESY